MINIRLLIKKCRENNPCISEFTKLVNSKTDEEFSEVLLNKLLWLKSKNLIQYISTKELLKYVGNNNKWIYNYCRFVEDRPKLWPNLKELEWIYYYLKDIKDRPELRIKLKEKK